MCTRQGAWVTWKKKIYIVDIHGPKKDLKSQINGLKHILRRRWESPMRAIGCARGHKNWQQNLPRSISDRATFPGIRTRWNQNKQTPPHGPGSICWNLAVNPPGRADRSRTLWKRGNSRLTRRTPCPWWKAPKYDRRARPAQNRGWPSLPTA